MAKVCTKLFLQQFNGIAVVNSYAIIQSSYGTSPDLAIDKSYVTYALAQPKDRIENWKPCVIVYSASKAKLHLLFTSCHAVICHVLRWHSRWHLTLLPYCYSVHSDYDLADQSLQSHRVDATPVLFNTFCLPMCVVGG